MLTRFTELRAPTVVVLLALALGGCASAPATDPLAAPSGTSPAATDAGSTVRERPARDRRWLPDPRAVFGGAKQNKDATDATAAARNDATPSVPAPKVANRNVAAFEEAIEAMKAEDWSSAEQLLRRITDDQPELAGPWVNLGQVYVQLGEIEEARLAFRRAIAANPQNCAAYNQLGVLFRTQGEFDEAENHYLQCIGSVAPQPEAYLNLGILYELYLGRLKDALQAYRQYQELVPEPDRKVAGWVMDLERRTGG